MWLVGAALGTTKSACSQKISSWKSPSLIFFGTKYRCRFVLPPSAQGACQRWQRVGQSQKLPSTDDFVYCSIFCQRSALNQLEILTHNPPLSIHPCSPLLSSPLLSSLLLGLSLFLSLPLSLFPPPSGLRPCSPRYSSPVQGSGSRTRALISRCRMWTRTTTRTRTTSSTSSIPFEPTPTATTTPTVSPAKLFPPTLASSTAPCTWTSPTTWHSPARSWSA